MKSKFAPIAFEQVKFSDKFWAPRLKINRESTLPKEYAILKKTGRLTSFDLKTKNVHEFWDSDTAKWVEAAAYSLATHPDRKLEKQVDEFVDLLAKAQNADGYLNAYFQSGRMEGRWSDLRGMHELYCAGHLMEAAAALKQHCGKDKMLKALCRFADHIKSLFGREKGKKRGYCGHPEIELALVRLYRASGNREYLKLAAYFVKERGQIPHYYDIEDAVRGTKNGRQLYGSYDGCQAHMPLREQADAEGHAVRAAYLFAGMVDVASEIGDADLFKACRRLWKSITKRRMYITGGIGSIHKGERFTIDYDLPDENAYAETCAAIGLVFFAQRLLNADINREYADVMEQVLYNCVASGVSLDGARFFYSNRLAVYPKLLEKTMITNQKSSFRQEWFGCACCPPNIARLYASLGSYAASVGGDKLALHLYASGEFAAKLDSGETKLCVKTEYPWDGKVSITVKQAQRFTLCLRLPGWCAKPALKVNGKKVDLRKLTKAGYAHLDRQWAVGDRVALDLPMEIERLEAHPTVRQITGMVALRRGPMIYCLEECDNGADLADIALPRGAKLSAKRENILGGCVTISSKALRRSLKGWEGQLYQPVFSKTESIDIKAVPYCLWDNRKEGEMRVWIREA